MTPRWSQVKQAVVAALARAPEDRAAYLEAIGATDPELGREVESLLAHHVEEEFLEHPAVPAVTAEGSALGPGDLFGQYQIQSPLGEGGMGLVFLAQDRALDRPVALKFLSDALQQREDARRRFLREAKAAAALDHPYICKIYQTGEQDDRPFIAMEYVRGETLRHRLDTAPLPLTEILRVGVEVAEALETSHAAQIVHRDLKPSNIMLTAGGHVKVLDFGLAKRIGEAAGVYATGPASVSTMSAKASLTETGVLQGTVAYMSPEQVRRQEVDLRSDFFSLGVVLYESLTGKNPFRAGSLLETASQILHHDPPPLGLARSDVPTELEQVVRRMLAKAPEDRYASAHDLRAALTRVREIVDRGPVPAPDAATPDGSERNFVLRRRLVSALAATALTIAGGGVWWSTRAPGGTPANRATLSVAVMPFANVSGDPQNDYLANGIAQAVTTRLHRAGLRVIPWETARRFRDSSNAMQVARALRVDAVLSGSFQIDDDRLLVTVSLVEGTTGFISWTDEFADSFDDIFQMQTRIAQGVATNLGHELTGDSAARLAVKESSSSDAYDFYLQGADYLQEGDRESTNIAYDFFTRAVSIDPNLAEAHVGLGAVYLERFWNGWGGGPGNLRLAESSFDTVLKRDSTDVRARRGMNLIEWYRGRGESALQFARDAARYGVDDIEILLASAAVYANGGPEEFAPPLLDRVLTLDPGNQTAAWLLITALHNTERFVEAANASDEYARRFQSDSFVGILAANALERVGDVDGARDWYDRVTESLMRTPVVPGSVTAYDLATLLAAGAFHSRGGQRDRARVLWQRGVHLTTQVLADDPESIGIRLYHASFLGVLGDRAAFAREEAAALARAEAAEVNPWELVHVANAHAHVGNASRALEILRDSLRRGRMLARPWLTLTAPALERAEGFADFLREYNDVRERRRQLYGRGS